MSENLSRYFENTGSVFDSILSPGPPPPPETGVVVQEKENVVPDGIRDLWLRPDPDAAVTLLTSPGILSTNELVGSSGSIQQSRLLLIMPHRFSFQSDPILEKSVELLGKEVAKERNTLLPDDVTQDERGLRKLIDERCFRSGVNLTTRLLGIYGQGVGRLGQPAKHTPHSLQLWFTRFCLLVKLGLFELVTSEAEAFQRLTRPDVYFDFYPELYNKRTGSMASFSFRLLLAELPMYSGQEKVALDNLSNVSAICRQIKDQLTKIGDAQGAAFWTRRYARTLQSMVNCSLAMKNYGLVHSLMKQLVDLQIWSSQEQRDLHSTWVRHQIGLQGTDSSKFIHLPFLAVSHLLAVW